MSVAASLYYSLWPKELDGKTTQKPVVAKSISTTKDTSLENTLFNELFSHYSSTTDSISTSQVSTSTKFAPHVSCGYLPTAVHPELLLKATCESILHEPEDFDGSTSAYQMHERIALAQRKTGGFAQELITNDKECKLKLNNTYWLSVKSKVDQLMKLSVIHESKLNLEEVLAIHLYTSNEFYSGVNKAMRAEGAEKERETGITKWIFMINNFIRGFRKLPLFVGQVYRGVHMTTEELSKFTLHCIYKFSSFVSCTRKLSVASSFAAKKMTSPDLRRVIMCIYSTTGRCVDMLSRYPEEEEVVFRGNTYFKVMKVDKIMMDDNGVPTPIYYMELRQEYEDVTSRKFLLWVDGNLDKEIKTKSRLQRDNSLSYSFKVSTLDAYKTLLHIWDDIKSTLPKDDEAPIGPKKPFHVITNMARKENGINMTKDGINIDAGLDLVCLLVVEFGYRQKIVVFTSAQYLEINKKKFVDFPNVIVVCSIEDCLKHASFDDSNNKPLLTMAAHSKLKEVAWIKKRTQEVKTKMLELISEEQRGQIKLFDFKETTISQTTISPEIEKTITSSVEKFTVLKESIWANYGEWSFAIITSLELNQKHISYCEQPTIQTLPNGEFQCFVTEAAIPYQKRVMFDIIHQPKTKIPGHKSQMDIQFGGKSILETCSGVFNPGFTVRLDKACKGHPVYLCNVSDKTQKAITSYSARFEGWTGKQEVGITQKKWIGDDDSEDQEQEQQQGHDNKNEGGLRRRNETTTRRDGVLAELELGRVTPCYMTYVPPVDKKGKTPDVVFNLSIFVVPAKPDIVMEQESTKLTGTKKSNNKD